jgi:hypothetical protein
MGKTFLPNPVSALASFTAIEYASVNLLHPIQNSRMEEMMAL